VETDEEGRSVLRFGNGVNGRSLPEGAVVHCTYQVGRGLDGNVGADRLRYFDADAYSAVSACWNPFGVTNGRAPEPVAEIVRRVPEAYRARQLRAVTVQDYVDRAEELDEVARAAAQYRWTGSWRTVRVAIDPAGTTTLEAGVIERVAEHLNAVRLIGEDLEIRPPRFVPLQVEIRLCIHPGYWPEDVRTVLEEAFSTGYTADGRRAFFHPDQWTFGQALYASQVLGAAQAVEGVDHVIEVRLRRWNAATPGFRDRIDVRSNEIILVDNDPDHLERGFIAFDIQGGRR
jgi:predicted phage baseplate assembly protein